MDKADSAPVIRLLAEDDRPAWLSLRQALWMGSDASTRAAETGALLSEPQRFGALAYGVLLAFAGTRAIGFIEVSLRDDLPAFAGRAVGYVEGVYVEPSAQSRGLGRALVHAAEAWARARGAGDLASDVLADNAASLDFHARVGFVAVGETVTADRRQVLLAKRLA
jgi:aminoglycoside 6'-N-acetyltransferase I